MSKLESGVFKIPKTDSLDIELFPKPDQAAVQELIKS